MKSNEEIVEEMAEAIYHSSHGLTDEQYKQFFGKEPKIWKLPRNVTTDSVEVVSEWERDDYRRMSRVALDIANKYNKESK